MPLRHWLCLFFILISGCQKKTSIPSDLPLFEGEYFAFSALGPAFLDVSGYQTNCRLELFRTDPEPKQFGFQMSGEKYELNFFAQTGLISVHSDNEKQKLSVQLSEILNKVLEYQGNPHRVPQADLTFLVSSGTLEGKLVIYNVSFRKVGKNFKVEHIKSDLLLRRKS